MDTDTLYLALNEKELNDCIRLEMEAESEQLRSGQKVVPMVSLLMHLELLSAESVVTSTKHMTSENLLFSKRSSSVLKGCVVVVSFNAATKKPLTG